MSLTNIKEQALAIKLLKRSAASGRLAHAYLFYGPDGVGKKLAAREFAKSLNCTEGKEDCCDYCSSCMKIEQNNHPDILWIYPSGKSRVIKIEQMRQLQNFIAWRPYEGRFKVCIIADAHTLKMEAANAFLKTLEEPPDNSVLILVTHMPELLLPTIKSRTQGVQFFNLSQIIIEDLLTEKMGYSGGDAHKYSLLSMGSMDRALSFRDENMFNQRKFILDILAEGTMHTMKNLMDKMEEILDRLEQFKEELIKQIKKADTKKDAPENEHGINNITDENQEEDAFVAGEYRKRVEDILSLILSWYRDILICKNSHKDEMLMNNDYSDRIMYWSSKLSTDDLLEKMRVVEEIKAALARQINLKLLFQVMFVKLELV